MARSDMILEVVQVFSHIIALVHGAGNSLNVVFQPYVAL